MLINRLRISYVRGILVGLLPLVALIVMQIAAAKTVNLPDRSIDSTGSSDTAKKNNPTLFYHAVCPPSTTEVLAVINPEASEQR